MNQTFECATKCFFGSSTLFFIAITGELQTYFFPFRYHDKFIFLLQVSTVFSLVTGVFWLFFTVANSLLSADYGVFMGSV